MATLAVLCPGGALAVERGCAAIAIAADPDFRSRFPELLVRIQSELSGRTDIDACAHVELTLQADGLLVSVALPDGRAAARHVARPEDALDALQALLLVPEPAPRPPAPRPPAPRPPAPAGAAPRAPRAALSDRDVPATPIAPRRQLGFELSVISGVRIGDGQYGYGVGMLSFLEVGGWLIGFEGRADGYRSVYGSDPDTAIELALLGGRRVELGSVALDLTAGPAIAMKGIALSHTESATVEVTRAGASRTTISESTSTGAVPRLLLGARLGFTPRSVFRTFVGIDGELGPPRGDSEPGSSSKNSARLPAFSLGLALGATVGTP